jgi:hypothetical protein
LFGARVRPGAFAATQRRHTAKSQSTLLQLSLSQIATAPGEMGVRATCFQKQNQRTHEQDETTASRQGKTNPPPAVYLSKSR